MPIHWWLIESQKRRKKSLASYTQVIILYQSYEDSFFGFFLFIFFKFIFNAFIGKLLSKRTITDRSATMIKCLCILVVRGPSYSVFYNCTESKILIQRAVSELWMYVCVIGWIYFSPMYPLWILFFSFTLSNFDRRM